MGVEPEMIADYPCTTGEGCLWRDRPVNRAEVGERGFGRLPVAPCLHQDVQHPPFWSTARQRRCFHPLIFSCCKGAALIVEAGSLPPPPPGLVVRQRCYEVVDSGRMREVVVLHRTGG